VSSKPLDGVLIVDLSRYLPGPLTAKMLANLGARVIKIEEPEFGDPVRSAPPMEKGKSRLARLLLSGVESVALDLKRREAREVLEALLENADALLESVRPGKLAEFGMSEGSLRERFPRLIVCSISGWGNSGPLRARAGHDLTYQAAAGALAPTGDMPNLPVADLMGAFAAVSAVSAALLARERSGRGTFIDASLFDAAMIANLTNVASSAGDRSVEVGERTNLTGAYPCYRIYDTADGRRFALAALEARFWKVLCQAVDRPDLVPLQYRRDAESLERLEELFRTRSATEWSDLCHRLDLPGETVHSVREAGCSEQNQVRDLTTQAGRLPFPALLDRERPEASPSFPVLGEHTRSVVEEFARQTVQRSRRALRAAGIGRRLTFRQFVSHWVAGRRN
jgi:crotonobetainyl-CoA:carnitine CoA-transferase CaiB-like acyl-CoA transferase